MRFNGQNNAIIHEPTKQGADTIETIETVGQVPSFLHVISIAYNSINFLY